jgi:transcriptional regulator with XRE-family HTH domain
MNKRLKKLLVDEGMQPEYLAVKIGVSMATISRLDPVKPPRKPLALAVVAATGIPWEELFPEQNKAPTKKAG